jgi:hypothetical protein
MPVAPRQKTKATKIAFKILGKPANLQKHKLSKVQQKINNRLIFEETARVR